MAFKNYYTMNGQIIGESGPEGAVDYQLDGLGSMIGTWRTTGTLQNQYRYSGYGQLVHKSGAGADPYFLWVGGWGYRTRGMVYVRRRTYYENAAVWTSVDPLWPDESAYAYGTGRPTTNIDVTGLDVITSPLPNTSIPPSWFPPDKSPVRSPIRTSVPGSHQPGVVTLIVAGAYAVYDLVNWTLTGNEGLFTGIGSDLGKACFPGVDSIPKTRGEECKERYRQYKFKDCKGATCKRYRVPGDCALILKMMLQVRKCAEGRVWVIKHCDRSPIELVPKWIPNERSHLQELCNVLENWCKCADKARKCPGGGGPTEEMCKALLDKCKRFK